MRTVIIALALAGLTATCGLGVAQAQPQPATPPATPDVNPGAGAPGDPAAALIKDRCTLCHDTDVIAATPRTAQSWSDLVASMVRRGASLSDDEKAEVAAYLAKTYPAPAQN